MSIRGLSVGGDTDSSGTALGVSAVAPHVAIDVIYINRRGAHIL